MATDEDFQLSSYDYDLPPERIAQSPVEPRDRSRLLVVESSDRASQGQFCDLPRWLQAGDLLVLNDTRVMPARLRGDKSTGAAVEVLLLENCGDNRWLALVKPGRRLPVGAQLAFVARDGSEERLHAEIVDRDAATGGRVLAFDRDILPELERFGEVPLPPYVTERRARADQYQTVYATRPGAVAAPTAGLHFTPELLQTLAAKGIERATVTLHVGLGTFRPVEIEAIAAHTMHQEFIDVPAATVAAIERTKAAGGQVFAVGTTVVRSLEGAAAATGGELAPFAGKTDLFIYPGHRFRVVDGLITNFHLPKSSLLMLVSAAIGRTRLLALYREAIALEYRFYSFGDAMLILPEAFR